MRLHRGDDGGQAVPLVVMMLLAVGFAFVVVARLGAVIDDAARAQTAADAAALAGSAHGRDAAAELAQANGGTLVAFSAHGSRVEVVVRFGGLAAVATAERVIEWSPP